MSKVLVALATTASLCLMFASTTYAVTIITNTPYRPGADTTLATFGNGNETVAETTYFQPASNGLGFDFAVQTDPTADPTQDRADLSLNDLFTNVYFGANDTTGAQVVFEFGNDDAVNLATNAKVNYTAALGIQYVITAGTAPNMGNNPSMSQVYVPYAAYDTILESLGIVPGPTIEIRDLQAFGYAGNNAGGGARFGTIPNPVPFAAVPESGTWAMMLVGFVAIGGALRRGRRIRVGYAFA